MARSLSSSFMHEPVEILPLIPTAADQADLSALLRDAVEGGASVGFMLPVRDVDLAQYWQGVFAEVETGGRILLGARADGRLVGSVQLELAGRPNSRHRAELQKLLVLRPHRGRGLGCALIGAAESAARARGRTLLALDTSSSGNALGVYARCGYTRAGVVPRYARDPDGPLIDTAIYYKELEVLAPSAPNQPASATVSGDRSAPRAEYIPEGRAS